MSIDILYIFPSFYILYFTFCFLKTAKELEGNSLFSDEAGRAVWWQQLKQNFKFEGRISQQAGAGCEEKTSPEKQFEPGRTGVVK